MIGSQNKAVAAGALMLGLAITATASAQSVGKPRSLIPPPGGQPPPAEKPFQPFQRPQPAPDATTPEPGADATGEQPVDERIEVGTLNALDPSAVGLLFGADGGFGIDMWRGTPRVVVERLLPRLPAPAPTATMRDMMRRLLLSAADVPAGDTILPAGGPGLLMLRMERLAAAGDTEAVTGLMQAASVRFDDPRPARLEMDAHWLDNDYGGACDIAREMLPRDPDPAWLKSVTFCRLLDEQSESAALAADLLREEGVDDPAFFDLIRILGGNDGLVVDTLPNPRPLHLAMLRAANRQIPPDVVMSRHPGVLRSVAGAPNATSELRLFAAERAEAVGALSADTLGEVYASLQFADEDRANAIDIAENDPGPRTRALLFQVAQRERVPTARAVALQTALKQAVAEGEYFTVARVANPTIRALQPVPEMVWAAADLGRALLAAGDTQRALAWFETARVLAARENVDAVAAVIELWPLVQLADTQRALPWDPTIAGHWWDATVDLPAAERSQQAALLFVLFEALGYEIPPALWTPLYEGALTDVARVPSPALRVMLRAAAADGRVGETVLVSLVMLGESGPGGTEVSVLADIVSALRAVGLEAEARGLAVEAALTHGM